VSKRRRRDNQTIVNERHLAEGREVRRSEKGGREASQLIVVKMCYLERREMARFGREARQSVGAEIQLLERRETPHCGREARQIVAVEK
jgi:hypothetical protein